MATTKYDVDSASDLLTLIAFDPTIADAPVRDKIRAFKADDLVLVTKVSSGALKITDVKKIDPDYISKHLLTE